MKVERLQEKKEKTFEPIKVVVTIESQQELDFLDEASINLCRGDIGVRHCLEKRDFWISILEKINIAVYQD